MRNLAVLICVLLFTATSHARWFETTDVEKGSSLYADNCASCHGANAEGDKHWPMPTSKGHYPAPPLNGMAHTWHHPLRQLVATVSFGNGAMPGFQHQLTTQQILDILAFVQSRWPDEIYADWSKMNQRHPG